MRLTHLIDRLIKKANELLSSYNKDALDKFEDSYWNSDLNQDSVDYITNLSNLKNRASLEDVIMYLEDYRHKILDDISDTIEELDILCLDETHIDASVSDDLIDEFFKTDYKSNCPSVFFSNMNKSFGIDVSKIVNDAHDKFLKSEED